MYPVIIIGWQPTRDQVIIDGPLIDDIIVIRHGDHNCGGLISSPVPQRCAQSPCLLYDRARGRNIGYQPTQRRQRDRSEIDQGLERQIIDKSRVKVYLHNQSPVPEMTRATQRRDND